jgi:tetratricopeptide (TPR) repeat protein
VLTCSAMSDDFDKLMAQARTARRDSRPKDAERLFSSAVDLCRENGNRLELAHALEALGQIERDMDRSDDALLRYEEAVAIYRTSGDQQKLAHAVRHVADIQRGAGRPELAEPLYREALAIYRLDPRTTPLNLANAIRGLAILKSDALQINEAITLWEEARSLYGAVGVEAGVEECERRLRKLRSFA